MKDYFKRGKTATKAGKNNFGRPPVYKDKEELLEAIVEYFEHRSSMAMADQHHKVMSVSQGGANGAELQDVYIVHEIPPTLFSLQYFTGLLKKGWEEYRGKPEFGEVIDFAETLIRDIKYIGAATGKWNANLMSKDLGFVERTETHVRTSIEISEGDIGRELASRLRAALGVESGGEASIH